MGTSKIMFFIMRPIANLILTLKVPTGEHPNLILRNSLFLNSDRGHVKIIDK